jgi:23S rRNA (uracil1939-C5)-methyltransferase
MVADFLWQGPGVYIDAYAGVGGFSKALLRKGSCEITAIESNRACFGALEALGTLPQPSPPSRQGETLGLVLDPPKKGLMQEAETYAKLSAKRVALVSCDPDSMVRDLKVLLAHGYEVQRIVPMDLFGGTPAVETIVFLSQSAQT